MVSVDGDAACVFAYGFNTNVPEFFNMSITQYSATALFARLVMSSDYQEGYYMTFGNLTASEVHTGLLALDHGTTHLESCVVGLSLTALMIIVVGMRIYSRLRILTGKLRVDDWLILAGAIIGIGISIILWLLKVYGGIGKHYYDVSGKETMAHLKLTWAMNLGFSTAMLLIKLSFLFFYASLSPTRGFQLACWIIGGLITAGGVAIFFALTFECWPIDVWNHAAEAYLICPRVYITLMTQAVFSAVTDIILLCLPLSVVFSLKVVRLRDKIGMVCLFSLGGLVCFTSIIRMTLIKPYQLAPDWTRYAPMYCFWFVAETQLALIASSLPALRALILRAHSLVTDSSASPFSLHRRRQYGLYDITPEQGSGRGGGGDIPSNFDRTHEMHDNKKRRDSSGSGLKEFIKGNRGKLSAGWVKTSSGSDSGGGTNETDTGTGTGAVAGVQVAVPIANKIATVQSATEVFEMRENTPAHRSQSDRDIRGVTTPTRNKSVHSAKSFPAPPPNRPLPAVPVRPLSSTPPNTDNTGEAL